MTQVNIKQFMCDKRNFIYTCSIDILNRLQKIIILNNKIVIPGKIVIYGDAQTLVLESQH